MADAVAAPAPAKAQKAKKPTKSADHPKYNVMINTAVAALKERGGSSRQAILKYIMANYKVGNEVSKINARLKTALKAGVKAGTLKQVKGTGASGSFRLGEKVAAKPKVKKLKAAKPKVAKPKTAKPKKAKSPKKAAGAKKPKSPKKPKAAKPAKKAAKPKSPKKAKAPKKAAGAKKPKAAKSAKKAAKPKLPKKAKAPKKAKTPKKVTDFPYHPAFADVSYMLYFETVLHILRHQPEIPKILKKAKAAKA
jgi:histone H1/5